MRLAILSIVGMLEPNELLLNKGVFMKLFMAFVILACYGCSAPDLERDKMYINKLLEDNVSNGMSYHEIRGFILKHDKSFEIYNECTEKFQSDITPCNLGYSGISKVRLKSVDSKEDIAQIYYSFDSQLNLTNYSFEIYYASEH